MKFLLVAINAKYIHSNPAIYSLRAYAGAKLRPHVELAEYTINQYMQEILGDIYHRKPDVIGFSCYIWNWKLVQELLTEIPKILPDTKLWLGGPEVSYDADVILRRYPQLTGIMVGEGEATFRELLEYYVKKAQLNAPESGQDKIWQSAAESGCGETKQSAEEIGCGDTWQSASEGDCDETWQTAAGREEDEGLKEIRGLCLHTGYTPCREPVDMSSIPFLYDDLKPFENKIIYYESSRGCPYRCSYCLSSIDKQVRFRSIDTVIRELQFFLDNRVKQVKFVDRTFNCNHEHTMAIWRHIYEHDNGVTNFHFEISADLLREDEIELLGRFRPGLAQLEIGVQSVNPDTLCAIKRVTDIGKLENNVAAIYKSGNVHMHLDLIAGLPYEDYQSFIQSFNRVIHMRPKQLQLGFLKVLKGSEMCDRTEEFDVRFIGQPPYEVLSTKWLSYEDVLRLKQIEEMVELYYNSAQFDYTMPYLERVFASPFAMYETLADFYRKKGYDTASPARIRRYDILLEFAMEYDGNRSAVYKELLTFDMYLRENMKSRPEFAVDLSGYKDAIREFYQKEEKERRFLPDYAGYDWKQLSKMTHLEPFSYPVWDTERMMGEYGERTVFVLFDYRKRNPLNYEASVQLV